MAIVKKEDLMKRVTEILKDNTTDEAISILEDIDDTLATSSEDWKTKYDELDKSWRKKYIDRFNNADSGSEEVEELEQEVEIINYGDLFAEK